jgi:putative salt-induced outer membrane protein
VVHRSAILLVWLCVLSLAARSDQVTLKNGDRLTGAIEKSDGKTLLIKTDFAGEVTLQWDAVTGIVSAEPLAVQLRSGETVVGKVTTADGKFAVVTANKGEITAAPDAVVAVRGGDAQKEWERLQHPRLRDFWSAMLDTGLSETRGNSALLAFSLAGKAARVAPRDKLSLYTTAVYATDNTTPPGRTTANAIEGGARFDYNLTPRFFVFGLADFAFDQFQHLDLRTVLGGGFGLHVIKTTNTTFDVFGGGNYNKEKFSPNPPLVLTRVTRNTAEVMAGEELDWKLNNRVAVTERFTLFPNLSESGEYRFQFDATAATKLKTWLSWQVTVADRYLSNPLPGLKSNDELLSTGLRLTFGKGSF